MTHKVGRAKHAEAVTAVEVYHVCDKSEPGGDEGCKKPGKAAEQGHVGDELEGLLLRTDGKEKEDQDVVIVGASAFYRVGDGSAQKERRKDPFLERVEKKYDRDDRKTDQEERDDVHGTLQSSVISPECLAVEHCRRKEKIIESNEIEGIEHAVQEVHALNVAFDGSYFLAHS